MIENIRLSFQGIWSHKLRSLLTMLGIIIGIASLISIVSTIKGTNEQIKNSLIGAGNNVVRIQLYQDDYVYEMAWNGIPEGIPAVSEDTAESLRGIANAEDVTIYNRRVEQNNGMFYKNTSFTSFEVYGIQADYFQTCGYSIKQGRNFLPKDYKNFSPVIIIDEVTAKSLFPDENPLGKTLEYKSIAYTVVAVVERSEKFEPVINSIEDYYTYYSDGTSTSGKVFIPSVNWPDLFAYDEPEEVAIRCTDTEAMSTVGKSAADILNKTSTNKNILFKAENLMQKAKDLQDLKNNTNIQLFFVASISLLVGGIGVMNIMLVSVTERTREIGLKKAIGAKKHRILGQFLTEAAVLTSIGGLLGAGAGIGLSEILSQVSQTPVAISVPSIFVAVLFSMLIGILFGLIPSVKASNLNPIDALRHE